MADKWNKCCNAGMAHLTKCMNYVGTQDNPCKCYIGLKVTKAN